MPTDPDHEQTIALMHEGRWSEAESRLEEALTNDPRDVRAHRLLGTLYHVTQRAEKAVVWLERAQTAQPRNISTLLNLGSVYLELDRAVEAERCFSQVVDLEPNSADGHFNLGLAAQRAGRVDDAEGHYVRALECDPEAQDVALNLAAVYAQQGRHDACIDTAREVLSHDASHLRARVLLLKALVALGRLAEADEALAQTPPPTSAALELQVMAGKLHALNGRLEQAVTAYRAALALDDTRTQTALDLARCLLDSGDFLAAVNVLRALIEQEPGVAEHHALLGVALHDAEETESALSAYDEALRLEPESVHFLTAKATLLFELGRDDAAGRAINAAIASAPAVVSPHLLRVEKMVEKGDLANALLACEHYLENIGAECNMLAARGFLLHAVGRTEAAASLMDYDELITATIIAPPEGYEDLVTFNAALVRHLLAHPSLSRQNAANKATQHGRQSGNLLFGNRGPFEAFEKVLWQGAERYVRELVRDPAHPFRANPPSLDAVYAWAVVLERAGYQTPHIHPTAWLSGVYYPKVPAIVQRGDSQQGWIEFGAPPPEFRLEPAAPTRRIQPQEGLLVLFPSYFYHRTIPYESEEERISIAFDFAPRVRR